MGRKRQKVRWTNVESENGFFAAEDDVSETLSTLSAASHAHYNYQHYYQQQQQPQHYKPYGRRPVAPRFERKAAEVYYDCESASEDLPNGFTKIRSKNLDVLFRRDYYATTTTAKKEEDYDSSSSSVSKKEDEEEDEVKEKSSSSSSEDPDEEETDKKKKPFKLNESSSPFYPNYVQQQNVYPAVPPHHPYMGRPNLFLYSPSSNTMIPCEEFVIPVGPEGSGPVYNGPNSQNVYLFSLPQGDNYVVPHYQMPYYPRNNLMYASDAEPSSAESTTPHSPPNMSAYSPPCWGEGVYMEQPYQYQPINYVNSPVEGEEDVVEVREEEDKGAAAQPATAKSDRHPRAAPVIPGLPPQSKKVQKKKRKKRVATLNPPSSSSSSSCSPAVVEAGSSEASPRSDSSPPPTSKADRFNGAQLAEAVEKKIYILKKEERFEKVQPPSPPLNKDRRPSQNAVDDRSVQESSQIRIAKRNELEKESERDNNLRNEQNEIEEESSLPKLSYSSVVTKSESKEEISSVVKSESKQDPLDIIRQPSPQKEEEEEVEEKLPSSLVETTTVSVEKEEENKEEWLQSSSSRRKSKRSRQFKNKKGISSSRNSPKRNPSLCEEDSKPQEDDTLENVEYRRSSTPEDEQVPQEQVRENELLSEENQSSELLSEERQSPELLPEEKPSFDESLQTQPTRSNLKKNKRNGKKKEASGTLTKPVIIQDGQIEIGCYQRVKRASEILNGYHLNEAVLKGHLDTLFISDIGTGIRCGPMGSGRLRVGKYNPPDRSGEILSMKDSIRNNENAQEGLALD